MKLVLADLIAVKIIASEILELVGDDMHLKPKRKRHRYFQFKFADISSFLVVFAFFIKLILEAFLEAMAIPNSWLAHYL